MSNARQAATTADEILQMKPTATTSEIIHHETVSEDVVPIM